MPQNASSPSTVTLSDDFARRHRVGVFRFLRFLGASPDLADDLCQEVFLVMVRQPPEDRGDAAVAGWLRRTAKHLLVSRLRTLRRGLEQASDADLDAVFVRYAGPLGDDGSYLDALSDCVERLDVRAKRLLHLRYTENRSRTEIADRLRLEVEGVKSSLRRTKAKLRACVERRLSS